MEALTELGEFKPCVIHYDKAGITEFVQEDVTIVWEWFGDGIQAGYSADDRRLVGVQWPTAKSVYAAGARRAVDVAKRLTSEHGMKWPATRIAKTLESLIETELAGSAGETKATEAAAKS